MKKLILSVLTFVVVLVSISHANSIGDISKVSNAKCITEYSNSTPVDTIDTVTFGQYPQSDTSGNSKEPIEWIVLDKQGDKALLLSKNILNMKIDNPNGDNLTNYAGGPIQTWFTNDFYNTAFNETEKSAILSDSTFADFHGDKVFTLNEKMVLTYFNVTASTWNDFYDSSATLSDDEKNEFNYDATFSPTINKIEGHQTNYSNKFKTSVNESYINEHNTIGPNGYVVFAFLWNDYSPVTFYMSKNGIVHPDTTSALGVRPAIWVSLSASSNIQGGLTTANDGSDPFHAVEAPSLNMASSKITREAYEQLPDEIKAGVKKDNIIDSNATKNANQKFLQNSTSGIDYSVYNSKISEAMNQSIKTTGNGNQYKYNFYQLNDINNDSVNELFIYRKKRNR